MSIILKTSEEIEKMRLACRLAAEVLDYITPFVKPGVTTEAAAEIKRLQKEVSELRKANEILRAASIFFAKELDRPSTR